jgi:hypothetical protein
MNFVGITNGETVYANKPLFDTTNAANVGTAAPGTQVIAARRDHVHAIGSGTVTLAMMTNLAQDQFIGRVTASTGVPETATITAAGRALIDDANAAAQRTTLGLGTAATTASTDYAVAAKGVTNGDSHNHVGGDGAVIYYDVPFAAHGLNATVALSSSTYAPLYYYGLTTTLYNYTIPRGGTLKNFRWNTNSAQPGTGSLVATVRVNNVDSALTATVAAGGAAQTATDLTHTVAVNAADALVIRITNNATSASAQVGGFSFELQIPTV